MLAELSPFTAIYLHALSESPPDGISIALKIYPSGGKVEDWL